MKLLLYNLLLFMVISFYFPTTFCQHGVGTSWQNEILLPRYNETLNPKQRGVLYNNMVVSSGGRIIISTSELNASNINHVFGHYLTFSDDGGNSWSTPGRFTPTDLVIGASSPKLAIDKNDYVYAIWSSVNPKALFISKLDLNLNILNDSIRVSSNMSYGNFVPHFTIDRKNRIHVMWNEGSTNSSNTAESFYSRSTDGGITWSSAVLLSSNDNHHSAFPHAQFDNAGDTIAIAWRDSVGGLNRWDVYLVFSTDGGQSWTPPIPTITSSDSDWDPDLIIDTNNRIHLFYTKYPATNPFLGARNYYTYSDNLGASWLLPNNPASGMFSDNYRSQLIEGTRYDEKNNILYVTWKDERDFNFSNGNVQGDIMMTYSTDRGINWVTPEFITDRNDSTVGFKAATVLPTGEFAVNYEVISEDDINNPATSVRVYFRKRELTITSVNDDNLSDKGYYLLQNYPNPFNPITLISYQLPVSSDVKLSIYNLLGEEILVLVNEHQNAGNYNETFDGSKLSSAIYFYRLQASEFSDVKKMILLK